MTTPAEPHETSFQSVRALLERITRTKHWKSNSKVDPAVVHTVIRLGLVDQVQQIAESTELPSPPKPRHRGPLPVPPASSARANALLEVHKSIAALKYNHTGVQYFSLNKKRSLHQIMETARSILSDCLPIKCIEAVFVALYLTSSMEDLDRIPISFKSCAGGTVYRHIVLAVRHGSRFGCLGISRKSTLSYKPLRFKSFSGLLAEFKRCYEALSHQLLSIKVGLPVPHDVLSHERICWRHSHVKVTRDETLQDTARADALNKLAQNWHKILETWRVSGNWSDEEGVPLSQADAPTAKKGKKSLSKPGQDASNAPSAAEAIEESSSDDEATQGSSERQILAV